MSRKLLLTTLNRALTAVAVLSLMCATSYAQLEVVLEDFESYTIGAAHGTINVFDPAGDTTATASIREYPVGSGNQALRFAFNIPAATLNQNVEAPFPVLAMNNLTGADGNGSRYILEYDVAIGSGPNNWWAFGGVVEASPFPSGPYGVNIDTSTVGTDFVTRSGGLPSAPPFGDPADFTRDDWSYRVVALKFSDDMTLAGQRVQMFVDNIRVRWLVPEPTSLVLGLVSAGALYLARRRRNRG